MATINFGGRVARSETQGDVYRHSGRLLAPHMEKATMTCTDSGDTTATTETWRVLPEYSCDTWEVFIDAESNDPELIIKGIDDSYSGSGATGTAGHELTGISGYTAGTGLVAGDLPKNFIVDQAWKGLEFQLKDASDATAFASVPIRVKAYRSGQSTLSGTFVTGTVTSS